MQKIGVKGGMSLTTGYHVEFEFKNKTLPFLEEFYGENGKDVVEMLCDEAQLPNVVATTGTLTGRYLGEGLINYPHTRSFTDLGLGFMCDAKLTPLKFLNAWYEHIFGEVYDKKFEYEDTIESARGKLPRSTNRVNRLSYIDDYVCNLRIMKTEPNKISSDGRAPIGYILENAYPYSIDAVPLAYGSSQLTRVTSSFYYTRHTVLYGTSKKHKRQNSDVPDQPVRPFNTELTGIYNELDFDDPAAGNFGLTPKRGGPIPLQVIEFQE